VYYHFTYLLFFVLESLFEHNWNVFNTICNYISCIFWCSGIFSVIGIMRSAEGVGGGGEEPVNITGAPSSGRGPGPDYITYVSVVPQPFEINPELLCSSVPFRFIINNFSRYIFAGAARKSFFTGAQSHSQGPSLWLLCQHIINKELLLLLLL
jgi:hypothetical protein